MNTVTISKKMTGGKELVIISRNEYEQFARAREIALFYEKLNNGLNVALREARHGKTKGPFESSKALTASLRK